MIVSDRFFLGEEDVMEGKNYSTTVTQISPSASWLSISRKDFHEKFLNIPNYKDIFLEAAKKKHD